MMIMMMDIGFASKFANKFTFKPCMIIFHACPRVVGLCTETQIASQTQTLSSLQTFFTRKKMYMT
jgi:hypothetical protein